MTDYVVKLDNKGSTCTTQHSQRIYNDFLSALLHHEAKSVVCSYFYRVHSQFYANTQTVGCGTRNSEAGTYAITSHRNWRIVNELLTNFQQGFSNIRPTEDSSGSVAASAVLPVASMINRQSTSAVWSPSVIFRAIQLHQSDKV
jgi:hypothetical protein